MAKAKGKEMALTIASQTGKERPQLNLGNPKKQNSWNQNVRWCSDQSFNSVVSQLKKEIKRKVYFKNLPASDTWMQGPGEGLVKQQQNPYRLRVSNLGCSDKGRRQRELFWEMWLLKNWDKDWKTSCLGKRAHPHFPTCFKQVSEKQTQPHNSRKTLLLLPSSLKEIIGLTATVQLSKYTEL